MSISLGDISRRLNSNSSEIGNIREEIKQMQSQPDRNIGLTVQKAVEKHMSAESVEKTIEQIVNKRMDVVSKQVDKLRAVQAVQAQTNARLSNPSSKGPTTTSVPACRTNELFEAKYWNCRRAVRIWPVDCSSEASMWAGVSEFFFDRLLIPPSDLPQEAVDSITKVLPGRRKRKIENEVIVKLNSVQLRDMIVSYAPNLRAWRDKDGSVQSATGIRLEIPDHLMAVFKTLERYGFYMKDKFKDGFHRHIRFDDMNMSLVIDYALPGEDKWHHTDFENAREELRSNAPPAYPRSSSSNAADVTEAPKVWGLPGNAAAGSAGASSNESERASNANDQPTDRENWPEEDEDMQS